MTVLDELLDEFDSEWRQGTSPPELEHFLRRVPKEHRGAALVELVAIDSEYRWRTPPRSSTPEALEAEPVAPSWRPLIEDYARRWPELAANGLPAIELIAEEFRIRQRWGDRPSVAHYLERFGDEPQLRHALDSVCDELASDESDTELVLRTEVEAREQVSPAEQPDLDGRSHLFGRYRLVKRIGQGGMGEVFLAEDTELERQVALKTPYLTQEIQLRQRFVNEAKAAASLRHPGICPIYDTGEVDGRPYLTMAYIEGPTLHELWQGTRRPPVTQVLTLFRKVAQAMQFAHETGIVHRDLKPSNVMIDSQGEPVVTDFGLALRETRSDDVRLTQAGETFGSPAYMSPEQVEGPSELGPAADIYSLGVMVFEALTGRLPFTGKVSEVFVQIARDAPPRLSAFCPGIDSELEQLCLRMMSKDPLDRPASMTEVTDRLRAISERLEGGKQDRGDNAAKRTTSLIAGLAGVTAVCALALMLLLPYLASENVHDASSAKRDSGNGVSSGEAPANAAAGSDRNKSFALSLDGVDDCIVTPIVYDGSHPLTFEAIIAPADPYGSGTIVSNAGKSGLTVRQVYDERDRQRSWSAVVQNESATVAEARHFSQFPHRPTHIAVVWNRATIEIFVDGRRQPSSSVALARVPATQLPFLIGTKYQEDSVAGLSDAWFHGKIDEVRFSNAARYQESFLPPVRLESDEATLALYHLDEGSGVICRDASANGNDAKILGARWVEEESLRQPSLFAKQMQRFVQQVQRPQPPRTGPALLVDRPEAYVQLPLLDVDLTKPFVIEVWATASSAFQWRDWRRVIASAGPISLNIPRFHDVFAFQAWQDGRGVNVNTRWPDSVRYSKRTHIAGQWDGSELELFINGCRCPTPMTRRNLAASQTSELLLAALQQASKEAITLGRRKNGKSVFGGLIDRFRLSRGVRYRSDFEPENFGSDEQTLVLYDFEVGSGNVLHDASGNAHHAQIVKARWIGPPE